MADSLRLKQEKYNIVLEYFLTVFCFLLGDGQSVWPQKVTQEKLEYKTKGIILIVLETEAQHAMQDHRKKTPEWSVAERAGVRGEPRHLYRSFKGQARQGKVNNLGLASSDNFREL